MLTRQNIQLWAFFASLLIPGCGDSTADYTGGSPPENQFCEEPQPGDPEYNLPLLYKFCGCSHDSALRNLCVGIDEGRCTPNLSDEANVWYGATCLPTCNSDSECPPLDGYPITCSIAHSPHVCAVVCDTGESCPPGTSCFNGLCLHDMREPQPE